jgi:hypothetical protein
MSVKGLGGSDRNQPNTAAELYQIFGLKCVLVVMERRAYKIGIVGYGSSAKTFHIPFIEASACFSLHSIVQRQARPGQVDAASDFHNVKVYRSLDDMLGDTQVNLIVITTPPESHFQLAAAALRANKHGKLYSCLYTFRPLIDMPLSRCREAIHAIFRGSRGTYLTRQVPKFASYGISE